MGKNDVTSGQAKNTGMTPNQKVNKAEEIISLSINIGCTKTRTRSWIRTRSRNWVWAWARTKARSYSQWVPLHPCLLERSLYKLV